MSRGLSTFFDHTYSDARILGDPLLREIKTSVINVARRQVTDEASGKKSKGKKSASALGDIFEVILHDTVLFPEGGGQPSDIGLIIVGGKVLEVLQVLRRGGHAVHFVKAVNGEVSGVETGVEVTVTLGDAGFARRLDHVCPLFWTLKWLRLISCM